MVASLPHKRFFSDGFETGNAGVWSALVDSKTNTGVVSATYFAALGSGDSNPREESSSCLMFWRSQQTPDVTTTLPTVGPASAGLIVRLTGSKVARDAGAESLLMNR